MTTTTTYPTATFTKLRNGSWGIKGHGLYAGWGATVTKRDGSTTDVSVERILWTGDDGLSIATFTPEESMRRVRKPRGRVCENCNERRAHREAFDLSRILGWACDRCIAEGDMSFC